MLGFEYQAKRNTWSTWIAKNRCKAIHLCLSRRLFTKEDRLTFLNNEPDVGSNKLDHSLSIGRAFLDPENAAHHIMKDVYKGLFTCPFDSISAHRGLVVFCYQRSL